METSDLAVTSRATFVERWVTNPRTLVAYSLLLGSVVGTGIWGRYLLAGGSVGLGFLLNAMLYYSLAGYAGVQLLREARLADLCAIAALVLQLLQFQIGSVVYRVVCGLYLTLTIGQDTVNVGAGALSVVQVGFVDADLPARIAINFVPVLFLSYFAHQRGSRLTRA